MAASPDGPCTCLSPADAVLLKRTLAATFGSAEVTDRDNGQDEAR